jgi:DNA helicase-2/ATP-dependent DNA helicase PcrA
MFKPISKTQNINWSEEQKNIFTHIQEEKNPSLLISAVPGSGKTTTLIEAIRRAPEKNILALAFSTKIVSGLRNKLPDTINIRTLNSLGNKTLCKYMCVEVNRNKLYNELKKRRVGKNFCSVLALCKYAKIHGIVPEDVKKQPAFVLLEDNIQNWEELANFYTIHFNKLIYLQARKLLTWNYDIAYTGHIDFDDQILIPVIYNLHFTTYDLIAVDEVQDLNELQLKMLQASLRSGGRVIGVGDPKQSIYGFRGATIHSMENFAKYFKCNFLPLHTCYRCSKKVIEHAQTLNIKIKAKADAPMGSVIYSSSWTIDSIKVNSCILCRTNAPLLYIATKFIQKKRPVQILGTKICTTLQKTIVHITGGKSIPIKIFLFKLQVHCKVLLEHSPEREGGLTDLEETFQALSKGLQNTRELRNLITNLFKTNNSKTIFSSIHKAKGLEWENVYILDAHLLPSKYAKTSWAIEQENNMHFVAITRALKNLTYISTNFLQED